MPSASLQSRIKAFEALAASQSPSSPPAKTATLGSSSATSRRPRQGTLNLLDSPISPSASTLQPIAPLPAVISSSTSRSPSPTVCRKTSLIDLRDWVVEDGPFGTAGSESTKVPSRARNVSAPLINLESPPKQRPPLPPRKPSTISVGGSPVSRALSVTSDSSATLRPPGSSELVLEHTYPPAAHKFGHAPASSISSFHSISLSSDGINMETHNELNFLPQDQDGRSVTDMDSASITESFEEILATSSVGPSVPTHFRWDIPQSIPKPDAPLTRPSLHHRSSVRSSSAASSSTTTVRARRPPPPPPPSLPRPRPPSSRTSLTSASASASDRSSILSTATTTSRTSVSTRSSTVGTNSKVSLHRPTPVPPSARIRYETLFSSAVLGQRQSEKQCLKSAPSFSQLKKGRQAAGWRGLSLDLLTQPEDHPTLSENKEYEPGDNSDGEDEPVSANEKLNGHIIKYIWKNSRLDRRKLRDIWNECDPRHTGSLDRDAFVQGMWRIDEELRRAELARCTLALSAASSQRIPHRPLSKNSSPHRLFS